MFNAIIKSKKTDVVQVDYFNSKYIPKIRFWGFSFNNTLFIPKNSSKSDLICFIEVMKFNDEFSECNSKVFRFYLLMIIFQLYFVDDDRWNLYYYYFCIYVEDVETFHSCTLIHLFEHIPRMLHE